jgi:hypothetical protein
MPSGFYWRPAPALRAQGYKNFPLGKDRAAAIQIGEKLNADVLGAKAGHIAIACRDAFRRAKKRAAERAAPYLLSPGDEAAVIKAADGRCQVTGIRFSLWKGDGLRRRPFAPSVDRVVSANGYVPGNVRLVCISVNIALSDFGEATLRQMVRGARRREQKAA